MGVIILHSPYDGASRDFLSSLQVEIPEGDDVMVDVGGKGVRILSDHTKCVQFFPTLRAYPALLVVLGQDVYAKDAPKDWALDALPFIDDPVGAFLPKQSWTSGEFLDAISWTEKAAIEEFVEGNSTHARTLRAMWRELNSGARANKVFTRSDLADYVFPAFVGAGIFTQERVEEILGGV